MTTTTIKFPTTNLQTRKAYLQKRKALQQQIVATILRNMK